MQPTLSQLLAAHGVSLAAELSYMTAADAEAAARREFRLLAECAHGNLHEAADFEALCVSSDYVSDIEGAL